MALRKARREARKSEHKPRFRFLCAAAELASWSGWKNAKPQFETHFDKQHSTVRARDQRKLQLNAKLWQQLSCSPGRRIASCTEPSGRNTNDWTSPSTPACEEQRAQQKEFNKLSKIHRMRTKISSSSNPNCLLLELQCSLLVWFGSNGRRGESCSQGQCSERRLCETASRQSVKTRGAPTSETALRDKQRSNQ